MSISNVSAAQKAEPGIPLASAGENFIAEYSNRLDAKLVKCAVPANATPMGLAEFAQQGKDQKALIDKLLSDTVLMKQMLPVTPNNAGASIDIALPYTVGMWEDTKPVEIELAKGKSVLHFTRDIPNYGLTINSN